MIVEGIGQKAPAPISVKLGRGECLGLLEHAENQAEYRGYARRESLWSQGIKPGMDDPVVGRIDRAVRPIYCGLLGEWAICKLIQRRAGLDVFPDLKLRRTGDDGIDIHGLLNIQVKTRQRERTYNLIRVDYRDCIPLLKPCETHAFCQWLSGDVVQVLGWMWTRDLIGREIVAGVGDWRNVEPDDEDLRPVARLIDEIRSRQEKK